MLFYERMNFEPLQIKIRNIFTRNINPIGNVVILYIRLIQIVQEYEWHDWFAKESSAYTSITTFGVQKHCTNITYKNLNEWQFMMNNDYVYFGSKQLVFT